MIFFLSAIEHLIRWYCREAGVRHLEKKIEQIHRKCARKVVEKQEERMFFFYSIKSYINF